MGELGKNCRELRQHIARDSILKAFLAEGDEDDLYLAHTRWASVGAINIPNCHPINNSTLLPLRGRPSCEKSYPRYGKGSWSINATLNGDIDNYLQIKATERVRGPAGRPAHDHGCQSHPSPDREVSLGGDDLQEAFRKAVSSFRGIARDRHGIQPRAGEDVPCLAGQRAITFRRALSCTNISSPPRSMDSSRRLRNSSKWMASAPAWKAIPDHGPDLHPAERSGRMAFRHRSDLL